MRRSGSRRLRIRSRFSTENDITLFHGDCLALLQSIPDETAQLIVTSPPYNVGKSYEKRTSLDEYLDLQRAVIAQCVRVLKDGGSICWEVGHHISRRAQVLPLDLILHPIFASHPQLCLRNRIVWHFEHGLHCTYRFSGRYETILWYTKGHEYVFNLDPLRVPQKYPGKKAYRGPRRGAYSGHPLGKNPGDVWSFPNVKCKHVEKTKHPCQFPIELPERLILALSNEGDLVVDPFLGVGTTAVAATMHKRRAAGADIICEYLGIARNRIMAAVQGVVPYRPLGKEIHVPKSHTALTTSPFMQDRP